MKALIIGANGRLGNALISHLDSEGWEISVLVRSTFKVKQKDKLKAIFKGDVLDLPSLKEATKGIDVVFNAIGAKQFWKPLTTLSEGVRNILDAMQQSGVKKYVGVGPATILDDPNGGFRGEIGLPSILKHLYDDNVRLFNIVKSNNLPWVIVCPNFMPNGKLTKKYRLEKNLLPENGTEASVQDVAHALVQIAQSSDFDNNRVGIAY
jgi:uncharacterized protein